MVVKNDLKEYLKEENSWQPLILVRRLYLSLITAGIERGDSVICQSVIFSVSANPILYLGAEPVFIDSEIDT